MHIVRDVPDNLVAAALAILNEPDPWCKAQLSQATVLAWRAGSLPIRPQTQSQGVQPESAGQTSLGNSATQQLCHFTVPERPARCDDRVRLVPPGQVPKLGKGGSLASRQAIVHSLCHIESWAVDLSWDIIARFGAQPDLAPFLPHAFFEDFVSVADDECRHFLLLEARLRALGSHYGALAAHDGLWESAARTAHSLPARLAVEHCVHEARGLDRLPATIDNFRRNGDEETAVLLEAVIYPEEVTHCAAGVRWLKHLFQAARDIKPDPSRFQDSEGVGTQVGGPDPCRPVQPKWLAPV